VRLISGPLKVVLVGLLIQLLSASTAHAHAELVSAEPAPGALLATSPGMVQLEFSEALRPGSGVTIFGSGFRSVSGVEAAVDLTQPTRLVATVPELTPDTYTVQWTSLSVDGDMLSGSYAFGVQPPPERPIVVVALLSAGLIGLALVAVIVARRRGPRVSKPLV
jgi:methionine-rich copper-binding protein CopC